ncbi:tetratricopeptide repeat protein (macronuclear) [Tetrahymena thermophila SB210]|uniref:Tetratricopeptide repeat protein n=1 Tax=Tetrahymena thermophila (strain SB210) TaxID=312017 RepID=I7LW09_TETTS|nr:tetratricopeptide repeat protein [Tetrahymena thermophila SB210]EAS00539.2 tetratricopeptide repeat protein [Tetrahymena thermophila SB210]|eukprot:XP_001020784.2 tetratricopeptide repeat protein [Tetrahymena thermophila SB210]
MIVKQKEIHVFFANKQTIVFNENIKQLTQKIQKQYSENPHDIQLQTILVQIYYKYQNNYKIALKMIKDILLQDKLQMDARLDLAEVMLEFNIGSKEDIQNLINECYNLDSNYWRTYFTHIKYYDSIDSNDLFLSNVLQKFLIKFPDNIWLKVYLLQVLSDSNKSQLKEENAKEILDSEFLDYDLMRRLSYFLMNVGFNDKVVQLLEQGLKLNPNSFICLNNLGYFMKTNHKNNLKCIELCKKALQQNCRSLATLNNIAYTYQNMNNYKESTKYLKKCLDVYSYSPCQFQNIAYNYQEIEEFEMSFYYLLKGLKKFPNSAILNVQQQLIFFQISDEGIIDKEEFELLSQKNCDLQLKLNEPYYYNTHLIFNLVFQ